MFIAGSLDIKSDQIHQPPLPLRLLPLLLPRDLSQPTGGCLSVNQYPQSSALLISKTSFFKDFFFKCIYLAVLGLAAACRVFCIGMQAQWLHGLSCSMACGILIPRAGIEPVSSALEGRFLTTGQPGKSSKTSYEKSPSPRVFSSRY